MRPRNVGVVVKRAVELDRLEELPDGTELDHVDRGAFDAATKVLTHDVDRRLPGLHPLVRHGRPSRLCRVLSIPRMILIAHATDGATGHRQGRS